MLFFLSFVQANLLKYSRIYQINDWAFITDWMFGIKIYISNSYNVLIQYKHQIANFDITLTLRGM